MKKVIYRLYKNTTREYVNYIVIDINWTYIQIMEAIKIHADKHYSDIDRVELTFEDIN